MARSHQRRRWSQRYAAYAHKGWADTPILARNTLNSGRGRRTPGNSRRPPTEGALDVSARHCTSHVAHGGDPTGDGMDYPGPNSKRDHRHTGHSQRGLRVSINILRYFPRSGSPVRFHNFESLRNFRKGRLQCSGPSAVADSQATG